MIEKEFIEKWSEKIAVALGEFPRDYCAASNVRKIEIEEKAIKLGSEFFGGIEILNSYGEPVLMTEDYDEAKFILYAFRFGKEIELPEDRAELKECVKNYEKKLDDFIREIKNDFEFHFEDKTVLLDVTNKIFRKLNLQRH